MAVNGMALIFDSSPMAPTMVRSVPGQYVALSARHPGSLPPGAGAAPPWLRGAVRSSSWGPGFRYFLPSMSLQAPCSVKRQLRASLDGHLVVPVAQQGVVRPDSGRHRVLPNAAIRCWTHVPCERGKRPPDLRVAPHRRGFVVEALQHGKRDLAPREEAPRRCSGRCVKAFHRGVHGARSRRGVWAWFIRSLRSACVRPVRAGGFSRCGRFPLRLLRVDLDGHVVGSSH